MDGSRTRCVPRARPLRARRSAGRSLDLQSRGREFKSRRVHPAGNATLKSRRRFAASPHHVPTSGAAVLEIHLEAANDLGRTRQAQAVSRAPGRRSPAGRGRTGRAQADDRRRIRNLEVSRVDMPRWLLRHMGDGSAQAPMKAVPSGDTPRGDARSLRSEGGLIGHPPVFCTGLPSGEVTCRIEAS